MSESKADIAALARDTDKIAARYMALADGKARVLVDRMKLKQLARAVLSQQAEIERLRAALFDEHRFVPVDRYGDAAIQTERVDPCACIDCAAHRASTAQAGETATPA